MRTIDGSWVFSVSGSKYWDSSTPRYYGKELFFDTLPEDEFGHTIPLDSIVFPMTATNIVIKAASSPCLLRTYFRGSADETSDAKGCAVSGSNAVWRIQRGVQMHWTTTDGTAYVPITGKPDVKFVFEEGSELFLDDHQTGYTWASGSLNSARTNIVLRGATVRLTHSTEDRRRLTGTLLVQASAEPSVIVAPEGLGFRKRSAAGGVPVVIVETGAVLRVEAEIVTDAANCEFIKRGGGALVIARSSDHEVKIRVEEGSLELEDGVSLPNAVIDVAAGARTGKALTTSLEDHEGNYVYDAPETLTVRAPLRLEGALVVRQGHARAGVPGALPAAVRLGDGAVVSDVSEPPTEPACLAGAAVRLDASRCGDLSDYGTLPNAGSTGGVFTRASGKVVRPSAAFGPGRPALHFDGGAYRLTGFTNDTTDITVFLVAQGMDAPEGGANPGAYKNVFSFADTDAWRTYCPNVNFIKDTGGTNSFVYYENESWSEADNQYAARALCLGRDPDAFRKFTYLDAKIKPLYDWRAPAVECVEIFSDTTAEETLYRCAQYGVGEKVENMKVNAGYRHHHHTSLVLGGRQNGCSGGAAVGARFLCGEFIVFFRRLDTYEKDEIVAYLRRKWLEAPGTVSVTLEVPTGTAAATLGFVTNVVKTGAGTLVCREAGSLSHGRVEVRAGTLAFDPVVADAAAVTTPDVSLALLPGAALGYRGGGTRAGELLLPEGGTVYAALLDRTAAKDAAVPLVRYGVFTPNGGSLVASPDVAAVPARVIHNETEGAFYLKEITGTLFILR